MIVGFFTSSYIHDEMIPNLNSIYSKRVEKKHRLGMDHSDVCLGTEFPPIQGD